MDAARTEPALGDLEAPALAEQNIAGGNADAPVVLFCTCERHAAKAGPQDRIGVAGGNARRNDVLRGPG